MGFFDFLKPVERNVASAGKGVFNFLKPVEQTGVDLVKSGTKVATIIPNEAKSVVGFATGNREAGVNAYNQAGEGLKVAKQAAQAIPRGVVQLAESVPTPGANTRQQSANSNPISKAVLGSEPIPSLQKQFIQEKQQKGIAQASGSTLLSFLGDVGSVAPIVHGTLKVAPSVAEGASAVAANEIGAIGKNVNPATDIHIPVGSGVLRVTAEDMAKLSKATDVGEVKSVIGDALPKNVVDEVAPRIALTNSPDVIGNIFSKALPPAPSAVSPALTPTPINDVVSPAGKGALPTPEATPVVADNPVSRVVEALRGQPSSLGQSPITGIEKLQEQQKSLYSAERSSRLAQTIPAAEGLTGRTALYSQKSVLEGKLPKVDATALVEHLRSKVSPDDVNGILDTLRTHPNLSGYEPITAQNTIANLFDEGKLPTPSEWEILNKASPELVATLKTTAIDSMTKWDIFKNYAHQGLGLPKSLMATFDLSGLGRQGLALGTRFPEQLANAAKEMGKAFVSDDYYKKAVGELGTRENAGLYDRWGLRLISRGQHAEQFSTQLGERIPIVGRGVAASDRAYNLGLSIERADVFDYIVQNLQDAGFKINQKSTLGIKHGGTLTYDINELSDAAGRSLTKYINTFSGVGTGKAGGLFEKWAPALSDTLFSPRLWKSRLDMLNPTFYAKLDGPAQKLALQNAGSFAAVAGTVLALAAKAGATVETDSRSSDFLKVKVGDTRYDILGGLQQNLVFAARQISGEKKNSTTGAITNLSSGKYGSANRLSVLSDLIQNKENPVLSTGQTLLKGTDKSGNKINPLTEIGKLFVPLNIQDTYKTIKNTGSIPEGLLKATIPGSVGIGVNTYGLQDIQPTSKQKAYIQQLQTNGAPKEQIDATREFYQVLKTGPDRAKASADINKAIAAGDNAKAQDIAQKYNKQYAQTFTPWVKKYSGYTNDKTLMKDYNKGQLKLTTSSLKTRVRSIKSNPLYTATTGGQ